MSNSGGCIVTTEHKTSLPYSVKLKTGDRVKISEKKEREWVWCVCKGKVGAWIPEKYLSRTNHLGALLCDYDSTELNAKKNEKLIFSREVSGWIWCANQNGKEGWIPKSKVRVVERANPFECSGKTRQ